MKQKSSKKSQYIEDKIKTNLQMENDIWNDWKFQMHWNKLWWVNPTNCGEINNTFCVSSKEYYLKDDNKTSHWVGP